jgi:DNA-binding response OmpR family regulator
MQQFMAGEEFNLLHTTSVDEAVAIATREPVDLLVFEWQPYRSSAVRLIETIRSCSPKRVPVICLSNQVAEMDILYQARGLVDECIVRPFSGLELGKRIDAWLRPGSSLIAEERDLVIGRFLLNPARRQVLLSGADLHLTPKEYDLVAFFFRNAGKVVSRQMVSMAVWGRAQCHDSRTVDTHIYRLRKKHGLVPENGVRLESVYTRGYRLEEVAVDASVGANLFAQHAPVDGKPSLGSSLPPLDWAVAVEP